MFALHWQSPDEGHVNVQILICSLVVFLVKLCQQAKRAENGFFFYDFLMYAIRFFSLTKNNFV
jgi:hypothetical protein